MEIMASSNSEKEVSPPATKATRVMKTAANTAAARRRRARRGLIRGFLSQEVLLEKANHVAVLEHLVVPLLGAMALVGENDELGRDLLRVERLFDLNGFTRRNARVGGALNDEERRVHFVDVGGG